MAKKDQEKNPIDSSQLFKAAFESIGLDVVVAEYLASLAQGDKPKATAKKTPLKTVQMDEALAEKLVLAATHYKTTVANLLRPFLKPFVNAIWLQVLEKMNAEAEESDD